MDMINSNPFVKTTAALHKDLKKQFKPKYIMSAEKAT